MDAILFDLDNTLYAPERELFALIDVRINRYMAEVAGIPSDRVDGLRRRYWKEYGVTLQGLIRHHGVDPEDYLDYVHDVDVATRLAPDPGLGQALSEISQPKFVFTNGTREHAQRVLGALGVAEHFEEIFDIRVATYMPKPFTAPYRQVLDTLGLEGRSCIMVEDSSENLRTAKELGMGTVLVGDEEPTPYVDVTVASAAQAGRAICNWPPVDAKGKPAPPAT